MTTPQRNPLKPIPMGIRRNLTSVRVSPNRRNQESAEDDSMAAILKSMQERQNDFEEKMAAMLTEIRSINRPPKVQSPTTNKEPQEVEAMQPVQAGSALQDIKSDMVRAAISRLQNIKIYENNKLNMQFDHFKEQCELFHKSVKKYGYTPEDVVEVFLIQINFEGHTAQIEEAAHANDSSTALEAFYTVVKDLVFGTQAPNQVKDVIKRLSMGQMFYKTLESYQINFPKHTNAEFRTPMAYFVGLHPSIQHQIGTSHPEFFTFEHPFHSLWANLREMMIQASIAENLVKEKEENDEKTTGHVGPYLSFLRRNQFNNTTSRQQSRGPNSKSTGRKGLNNTTTTSNTASANKADTPVQGQSVRNIFEISLKQAPMLAIELKIGGGSAVLARVDTCADATLITMECVERLRLLHNLIQIDKVTLRNVDGSDSYTHTAIDLEVSVGTSKQKVRFLVVEFDRPWEILIGNDVSTALQLRVTVADKLIEYKNDNNEWERLETHILFRAESATDIHEIELIYEPEEAQLRQNILTSYANIMTERTCAGRPPIREINHKIPLIDEDKILTKRFYKIKLPYKDQTIKTIHDRIQSGLWAPAITASASPGSAIAKTSDRTKCRYIIDLRERNANTQKMISAMPLMRDIVDAVTTAIYVSQIDVSDAYDQIAVTSEDVHKNTFTLGGHTLMSHGMLQGDCNAAATFQTVIQHILSPVLYKGVSVYIDDIIIHTSGNREEHDALIREVLDLLRQNEFYLNKRKVHLFVKKGEVLGQLVSRGFRQLAEDKVKAFEDFPTPKNKQQLQSFLGSVNWNADFLQGVHRLAGPLYAISGSKSNWDWNDKCQQAFLNIKELIKNAAHTKLVSIVPDKLAPTGSKFAPFKDTQENKGQFIMLATDASGEGIAATLCVGTSWNDRKPVCFFSRPLRGAEKNYPNQKREHLAVHWALTKIDYLHGYDIHVLTDNTYVASLMTKKDLPTDPAEIHWIIQEMELGVIMHHIPGELNTVADGLSRKYVRNDENVIEINEFRRLHQRKIQKPIIDYSKLLPLEDSDTDDFLGNHYPKLKSKPQPRKFNYSSSDSDDNYQQQRMLKNRNIPKHYTNVEHRNNILQNETFVESETDFGEESATSESDEDEHTRGTTRSQQTQTENPFSNKLNATGRVAIARARQHSQQAHNGDLSYEIQDDSVYHTDPSKEEISFAHLSNHDIEQAYANEIRLKRVIDDPSAYTQFECFQFMDKKFLRFTGGHGKGIVVPDCKSTNGISMREQIIWAAHVTLAHRAVGSTTETVKATYWWPGYTKQIQNLIKKCETCQMSHRNNKGRVGKIHMLPVARNKFSRLSMDFLQPPVPSVVNSSQYFDYLLVVVDRKTKSKTLIPCKKKCTGKEVLDLLETHIFSKWGFPNEIVTDRDPRFRAAAFQEGMARLGIQSKMSTPGHPETDGLTERANRDIHDIFRVILQNNDQNDWAKPSVIKNVERVLNATYSEAIGMTPYQAQFGCAPRVNPHKHNFDKMGESIDNEPSQDELTFNSSVMEDHNVMSNMDNTFQVNKSRKNEHKHAVGDFVYVSSRTLFPNNTDKWTSAYQGPYQVLESYPEISNYVLDLRGESGRLPRFHGKDLKRSDLTEAQKTALRRGDSVTDLEHDRGSDTTSEVQELDMPHSITS
jgi:hypothetical protein